MKHILLRGLIGKVEYQSKTIPERQRTGCIASDRSDLNGRYYRDPRSCNWGVRPWTRDGLGDNGPQASLSFELNEDEDELEVIHNGGDDLEGITVEGIAASAPTSDSLSPGGSTTVDLAGGDEGETVRLVVDGTVVGSYEIPDDASLTA